MNDTHHLQEALRLFEKPKPAPTKKSSSYCTKTISGSAPNVWRVKRLLRIRNKLHSFV